MKSLATPCLLAALVCIALSGCSTSDYRGQGYGETTPWTENLRPPADEKQFMGVDAKAREVERNLGVR